MQIDVTQVGPLFTNCYMVFDDKGCIVVDPGYDVGAIMNMLDGKQLDGIVVTHGHMDHIGALSDLVDATGAPVVAYKDEVERILDPVIMDAAYFGYLPVHEVDVQLEDGDEYAVGNMKFKVLHTPGHTVGSMCLYSADAGVLLSGDTLFKGTHGRTDFPGGSQEQMNESIHRLAELPAQTNVFPGHNSFSTIGDELYWMQRF